MFLEEVRRHKFLKTLLGFPVKEKEEASKLTNWVCMTNPDNGLPLYQERKTESSDLQEFTF